MGIFRFLNQQFFKNSHWSVVTLRGFFLVAFLIGIAVVVQSNWREQARDWAQNKPRSILATAMGDLLNNGTRVKVVKLRTSEGLFLEVYGAVEEGALPLMDRIQLPDRRDGYFHFKSRGARTEQASNLALKDLNGDKLLEIIAPSFDEQLNAKLNIYSYDPESKRFFLYQQ